MRKQKGSNKANAGQKEVEKKGGCAGERRGRGEVRERQEEAVNGAQAKSNSC